MNTWKAKALSVNCMNITAMTVIHASTKSSHLIFSAKTNTLFFKCLLKEGCETLKMINKQ